MLDGNESVLARARFSLYGFIGMTLNPGDFRALGVHFFREIVVGFNGEEEEKRKKLSQRGWEERKKEESENWPHSPANA